MSHTHTFQQQQVWLGSMDDRQQWKRSRYAAWATVITLHMAALTALFLAPKNRIAPPNAIAPTELLTLPRSLRRQEPMPRPPLIAPDLQVRPQPLQPTNPPDAIAESFRKQFLCQFSPPSAAIMARRAHGQRHNRHSQSPMSAFK